MTTIKNVTNAMEEWAPLRYQEGYDNAGLIVGDPNAEVSGIVIALDSTEEVVEEAIQKGANLIIAHHPIVFGGLKKFNGSNYVERTVIKAIKNDIAIYATHTALDTAKQGVSAKIAKTLGLVNTKVLIPKKGIIKKLTTYVPVKNTDVLKSALFAAGAGNIGNYDECSFTVSGQGTFRGNEHSNPVLGEKGKLEVADEIKLTVTFESKNENIILTALQENHPYDEVAYEIITTENIHQNVGMGMIGELTTEMDEIKFLSYVKMKMQTDCVRHSAFINKKIKKVAVLGGAGSFAIDNAKMAGADAYVSADFKYHEFFKAENSILLADIGHYESEQFTKNLLVDYLTKKFSNFAVVLSEKSTNPIYYI